MNDNQSLPIGTVLPGTCYRIEEKLGQGNFGITYRVRHTKFGNERALKEFFPRDLMDRDSSKSLEFETYKTNREKIDILKRRFEREAMALQACNYKSIVRIYDIFEANDTIYYLMDYIDGVPLSQFHTIIKSSKILKDRQTTPKQIEAIQYMLATQILIEVSKAIHYLHNLDKPISHYDLNPNNIIVRSLSALKAEPVLIDFGFARQYDEQGHQMSTLHISGGTSGYICPEQAQGKLQEFSPSNDIYALGGIWYFLLSGKTPPSFYDILQDETILTKSIPKEWQEFIQKAMAIKTQDRFQKIEDFQGAFLNPHNSYGSHMTSVLRGTINNEQSSSNSCDNRSKNIPSQTANIIHSDSKVQNTLLTQRVQSDTKAPEINNPKAQPGVNQPASFNRPVSRVSVAPKVLTSHTHDSSKSIVWKLIRFPLIVCKYIWYFLWCSFEEDYVDKLYSGTSDYIIWLLKGSSAVILLLLLNVFGVFIHLHFPEFFN